MKEKALLLSLDCSTVLDLYLVIFSVKQRDIKYHFWVFGMTRPGLPNYILCPHVYKFLQISQHWHIQVLGFIDECHFCVRFCFSSSLTSLVCPTWITLEIGGKRKDNCCFVRCCVQDLSNIARSIHLQLPSNFFSECVFSASMWFIHRVLLIQPQLGRNLVLFYRIDQTSI